MKLTCTCDDRFGAYELHDLVVLDQHTVGVIVEISKEACKVRSSVDLRSLLRAARPITVDMNVHGSACCTYRPRQAAYRQLCRTCLLLAC